MADIPPIAGWPNAISPIGEPHPRERRKLHPARQGRRRHLRSLKDLPHAKKPEEGWHG